MYTSHKYTKKLPYKFIKTILHLFYNTSNLPIPSKTSLIVKWVHLVKQIELHLLCLKYKAYSESDNFDKTWICLMIVS